MQNHLNAILFPDLSSTFPDAWGLPQCVAHHYGFALHSQPYHNQSFYAVQDWLVGLAGCPIPHDMWRQHKKLYRFIAPRCVSLPYRHEGKHTYCVDHADTPTLLLISQTVFPQTLLHERLLDYLAHSASLEHTKGWAA